MAFRTRFLATLCFLSLSTMGVAACDGASGGGVNDGQGSTLNNGVDDDHDGKVDEAGEIATSASADPSAQQPSDGNDPDAPLAGGDAGVVVEEDDDDDDDELTGVDASVASEPDAGLPPIDDDDDDDDDDFPFPGIP